MGDRASREFLEERLAATLAEAESLQIQADTALKYAEQVWWAWNLKRKRLKIHAAGECILGYPQEDMEHSEQFWWDRIHPEDLLEVQQSLDASLNSPNKIWRCEHRFMDVAGDWVWVEQAGFVHQSDGVHRASVFAKAASLAGIRIDLDPVIGPLVPAGSAGIDAHVFQKQAAAGAAVADGVHPFF